MPTTKVVQLLLIVCLVTVGQILFKVAAGRLRGLHPDTFQQLIRAAFDPVLVAALAVYAVATVLWVLILRDVELSRAYPFVAAQFVLVPLSGVVVLGEAWSPGLMMGIVLVVAGLWTIVRFG